MAESTPKTRLVSKIYVGTDVNKDLPPIIFLHAMLCSKEVWETIPQQVADATKRRVYVYDARNHGENLHTDEDFSFDRTVEDLFDFMEDIGAKTAILVGHSMGGITAIRAALKEPSKIEKLISVEMSVKELPKELIKRIVPFITKWRKAVKELPKSTKLEHVTRESVTALYKALPDDEQLPHEKDTYMKAKFLYNETKEGYDVKFNEKAILDFLEKYNQLEEKFYKDLKASGKQCEKPAYFIYATNSHYDIQSEKETIKKHFPKAEFVEINGASHFIFVEEPAKFTEELIKSLQK